MRRHSPELYSPSRRGYGGRERSPPRRGYGGSSRRGDRSHGSLLVRNIPIDCRPDELRIQFERFGLVRDVYLPRNYYNGEPRGFAFVEFVDPQDSADALYHMDGKSISGRRISVLVAAESRKRPEEMRHRSGTRGPSGYGGRRAYRGRSCSRSPSCSPSPRHQSGSRNRKRSRCRRDYSASPRWRPANDRSRSPPAPLEEQPGKGAVRHHHPITMDAIQMVKNGTLNRATLRTGHIDHLLVPDLGPLMVTHCQFADLERNLITCPAFN